MKSTKEIRKKRVDWCKRHEETKWRNVIFIDETCFYLNCGWNVKRWVKKFDLENNKSSKGTRLNVCGAICANGILSPHLYQQNTNSAKFISILQEIKEEADDLYKDEDYYFLMDGASYHFAGETLLAIKEMGIKVIENLWSYFKGELRKRKKFENILSLKTYLKKIWMDEKTSKITKNLSLSMAKRINL